MSPRVSAILPVWNGRRFLRAAVESVFAQTLPPCELIVVDDGSTDGSLAELDGLPEAPFPVRVLRQENAGQSSARNLAARSATGDFLAFLDQDDSWYPDHLAALVGPLLADGAVGWAYSDFDEMDYGGAMVTHGFLRVHAVPHPKHTIQECVTRDLMVLPSASALRRSAFEAVGGFDERLSGYEDDDLFVRFFRHGFTHAFVDRATVRFRVHATGSSGTRRFIASRRVFADKLAAMLPDDPRMLRFYVRDHLAPRFFVTTLDDYVRACSARQWPEAQAALDALNHFARQRQRSFGLRCKLLAIQSPRLFRLLVGFNDHLPRPLRFVRNPNVTLH